MDSKKLKKGCLIMVLIPVGLFVLIGMIGLIMGPPETEEAEPEPVTVSEPVATTLTPKPPVADVQAMAKPYRVVSTEDTSFYGRKRMNYYIYAPEAQTQGDMAKTVEAAARQLQRAPWTDVVFVYLEMSPKPEVVGWGLNLAKATFIPDRKGLSGNGSSPQLEVSACAQPPTEEEIRMVEAWYTNRDRFQENGVTNEDALIAYLKKELGREDIDLPIPIMKTVLTIE